MEVPTELGKAKAALGEGHYQLTEAVYQINSAKTSSLTHEQFIEKYDLLIKEGRESIHRAKDAIQALDELTNAIEQAEQFTKDFDLYPGDRIAISVPTRGATPARYTEGVVIKADWWGPKDGWYIEQNKDYSTPGWETGYDYWKQGIDGGEVRQL